MFFEHYGVNPFVLTDEDNLSTFAIDVDTGSYSIMRRYVSDGYLPPEEAVRVEEYINYFDQGYEPPSRGEGAFAIYLDGAPSRFADEKYHLVRVVLQGFEMSDEERKQWMDLPLKVRRKVIMEHKGDLHPQVIIEGEGGKSRRD